ncbi:MAG: MmgE/PrpD family protein, partial [Candidatus Rokubacteria bacterium]|nr:MmgE/PrpD family protein [Candidatus Rokubacteria bacterium]
MSYLDRLAGFAAATRLDTLPASTVSAAKAVVLDTLGAILAGSRLPENRRLAELAAERSGPRTATLIGHARQAEPMLAALVNGTAGVALEVDEGNRFGGGHPAIHVLPAALAVAEEQGLGGAQLLESLVAGYEVTSRLGSATRPRANLHSHGTWGTAGAAVAVAKLLGHPAADLSAVINLAVSMSPANTWTPCFEGATIRNLYPGRAGLQGLLAVHLLECGYTGIADAPADVYGTLLGEGFDPGAVVEGLGAGPCRIERNYFKLHACCLYNHPALDALQALLRTERFAPEDVVQISVTSIPFVARMADPAPPTPLAARFSVPYAVAAALVLGTTGVTAFSPAAVADSRIRELARRVRVGGDPAMSMRRADHPTASVSVTLNDGRVLSGSTTLVRGDAANPVAADELVAKFTALAADVLGPARATEVVEAVKRLDSLKDARELTALLAPASSSAGFARAPCGGG